MKTIHRSVAALELLLVFPAVLFMTALFARNVQPPQYEPAHTAQQIVDWYAARPHIGLWVLLIALPLAGDRFSHAGTRMAPQSGTAEHQSSDNRAHPHSGAFVPYRVCDRGGWWNPRYCCATRADRLSRSMNTKSHAALLRIVILSGGRASDRSRKICGCLCSA